MNRLSGNPIRSTHYITGVYLLTTQTSCQEWKKQNVKVTCPRAPIDMLSHLPKRDMRTNERNQRPGKGSFSPLAF